MVEHMSALQTQQQSFDGGRPQRTSWQHHQRRPDSAAGSAHHHHRFSLFRWFLKRRDSSSSADHRQHRGRSHRLFRRHKRRGSSSSNSSSSSSVDTFYSTATVRSFAFQSGAKNRDAADALVRLRESRSTGPAVGPFAPGAVKLVEKRRGDGLLKRRLQAATRTLPTAFSQRQDIETRYSLHPVVNSTFISYDSIPVVGRGARAFAEARRTVDQERNLNGDTLTSNSSSLTSAARRVHVKGKRRAPDPPTVANVDVVRLHPGRRKRRPAPKPPGHTDTTTTPQSSNQNTLSSEASAAGMDSLLTLKVTDCPIISNDTLVLRRGVLLSKKDVCGSPKSEPRTPATSVYADSDSGTALSATASTQTRDTGTNGSKPGSMMPRPWYKRNVLHESGTGSRDSTGTRRGGGDILRRLPSPVPPADAKEDNASPASTSSSLSSSFPFEGSLSRLGFFQRSADDKSKKENKRKSGVSILTNISELDKEAAAIVQEEQARNRASMILQAARLDEDFERRMGVSEDVVQEIVNSSMESSPRRSTRALISKFNAIGGSSFFGRNSSASPKAKAKRFSQDERDRDLSRYFLPMQTPPKRESAAMFTEVVHSPKAPVVAEVKPLTTTTTAKPAVSQSPKFDKSNTEFAKTLAAELDDVATGIAKLRRELDDRPRLVEKPKTDPSPALRPSPRDKELAKFNREFTKIFDEIDRQLRSRDSRLANARNSTSNPTENSISNQVAKVLDILVNAEKETEAAKSMSPPPASKSTNTSLDSAESSTPSNKEIGRTKRISGVDDKTTIELKEMLKEMKHSLPKRPKPKTSPERDEPADQTSKPSTSGGVGAKPTSSNKVSSGVQTSGNVRRIVTEITAGNPAPVRPRDSERKTTPPANTYQLIKDTEFAEMKRSRPENTYANVHGSAKPEPVRIERRPRLERTGSSEAEGSDEGEKLEEIKKQCMNTLAVNRLLRKLEAAIASGHHQQAAGLAKELAQLKIHCSVVRQRSCSAEQKLNLSLYIEDKQAHQGPIPLQLPANMTLAQLKAKIQIEFEIPANVQRWIIGKNLADNDESSLEELQAVEGSPVFLYLVAPPDLQDKEAIKTEKQEKEEQREEEVTVEGAELVMNEKNDEQELIHVIKAEIEPGPEPQAQPEPEAAAAVEEAKAEARVEEVKEEIELTKEEKLKRYEELMSLENCDVISNTEPIECPVCFMITVPNEGVILRDCLHSFCRLCVANTVRYCEEAEVRCPYRDADYTCESTLQEREIKALVAPEVYQQHLAKSIAQAENNAGKNAFHCKTPDCPGWCIYDDNVNNFLCPVCKFNNCLTCQAVHMGKNCRQYQEELKYSKETDHESKRTAAMLEEMVDRGEALPCPTCAVVLMKKWGCDWLRCSMCKTEICWVTRGPRWGPGGKGDTSGGCRCGENGVKCHPKCNYCH